ncbi:MAG: sigma-54-dependent Fis family transcriptional regulator [Candidatus Hydrogenedentes bacterium]|nr:sigma-54-dependent Fis family transcriptional regulator [Candidatus Hydrogenedentota bacterium]
MPKQRILVIDDEPLMREYAEEAMLRAGYRVDTAGNGADGIAAVNARGYDVVVTDLKMTPVDGVQVVQQVKADHPHVEIIVMTAYGTIETAVAALKAGAADYILKPFTPEVLELAVARALDRARMAEENRYLRAELNARYDFGAMVGESKSMAEVYEQIKKVAGSRATVLIRGESGTGKELVSHAIHVSSGRRDKPFIKVNCAALSAGILESELFGHEKGSFTGAHERKIGRFELADGGTLLLDEISEIDIDLQAKLLRALQEREIERVGGSETIKVDTRIVATSNRKLEDAVEQGKFREDLYYRLNVITLNLPPLRNRKEDIPALASVFVKRFALENGRAISGLSPAARQALLAYDWPGNVRELQNAVERAVVLTNAALLEPGDFQFSTIPPSRNGAAGLSPGTTVAEAERALIYVTLEHCNQNRTSAAEMLGISVRTLRNKLNEYNASTGDEE